MNIAKEDNSTPIEKIINLVETTLEEPHVEKHLKSHVDPYVEPNVETFVPTSGEPPT